MPQTVVVEQAFSLFPSWKLESSPMPTVMTHAVVGVALAQSLAPLRLRSRASWMVATFAMLPDADVIGFVLGVRYGDVLGHRGITHSLAFGAAVAICMAIWARGRFTAGDWKRIVLCAFLATISHGLLDALNNGGLGVAFFAPFDDARYFFPVTPIPVSPIGAGFFSSRGAEVFASELLWVWCPCAGAILAARVLRSRQPARRR